METISIHDLEPDNNNANRGTERGRYMIERSLEKLGAGRSILLDKNGKIIAGNKTAETAAEIGLEDVVIVRTKGEKLVAVMREDLDLDDNTGKARELAYADNRAGQVSLDFDPDVIKSDLEAGVELTDWFTSFELDEFSPPEIPKEADAEPQISRADELQKEWQVEAGQLWRLPSRTSGQEHRLICGDCTDEAIIKRLMGMEIANIEIHDPPYGMRLDTNFSGMESKMFKGKTGGAYDAPIIGDNVDFDPSHILANKTKEIFLWGADYYCERIPNKNKGSWFIWDKRLDESADKMWGSCFETVWSKTAHKRDFIRIKWAGVFGMENEPDKNRQHPTQKPVALYEWLLSRYSNAAAITLDYYLGAGGHVIAAENLSRQCRAVEISPAYVAVALQRYKDAFGIEPELIL